MRSWSRPEVPRVPGTGIPPRLFDTSTRRLVTSSTDGTASLYVCGITPYDATHLGHAATYLAFDTLVRSWLDAGYNVSYVQNTTDVDDPLLERAAATGVDWRELAASQTELFRGDMEALSILPPDHYVAVTSVIPEVAAAVDALLSNGLAYEVVADDSIDAQPDLYFDSAAAARSTPWHLGLESNFDRATMLALFAERGGDPDRVGKRDPLDPLLWRAARHGEPAWRTVLGFGRPGWHIECSVIAVNRLGATITVQGGGSDLVFPHHEFSAAHASALTDEPFARIYSHAGMVAYQGEKMSKSLGNLVLVSRLVAAGTDPRVIRLALLNHHYRTDWEWTDDALDSATQRLQSWRAWADGVAELQPAGVGVGDDARDDTVGTHASDDARKGTAGGTAGDTRNDTAGDTIVVRLRQALANDLDTPAALRAVDEAASGSDPATVVALDAVHALLGIDLRSR